ncbi:hypothetical protein PUN28_018472 [Cardiocondyla obscurior]|uniref:Uncharacterized protein n=1 Tax=Cardiocondyla obscurior TaxID=286306 RepID=A0AAW2EDY9_9HYME
MAFATEGEGREGRYRRRGKRKAEKGR